jgi:hypothetical protein
MVSYGAVGVSVVAFIASIESEFQRNTNKPVLIMEPKILFD